MNSWSGPWRLIEKFKRASEVKIWIRRNQLRRAESVDRLRNQNGRRARVLHLRRIFRIGEEGEVTRSGVLGAGDASDLNRAVTTQLAAQCGGEVGEIHVSMVSG